MKRKILIILITLGISSCSQPPSKIDIIKNTVLKIDKSRTIGDVFDKYEGCLNREWIQFNTKKEEKIVQFSCYLTPSFFKQEIKQPEDGEITYKLIFQFKMNGDTFDSIFSGFKLNYYADADTSLYGKTAKPVQKSKVGSYSNFRIKNEKDQQKTIRIDANKLLWAMYENKTLGEYSSD